MLDILKFIFQDFTHWAGATVMLSVVAAGVNGLVHVHYHK